MLDEMSRQRVHIRQAGEVFLNLFVGPELPHDCLLGNGDTSDSGEIRVADFLGSLPQCELGLRAYSMSHKE